MLNTEISERITRFASGGKYQRWEIMDDYIILNFCPRAALREVKIQDEKIKSHLFQVVIEPEELTAEIYTHDMQLCKAWSLSEGKQRVNTDFYGFNNPVPNTTDGGVPLHEPTQEREGTTVEIEEMRLQVEEMKREMERKREQREQEREREMEEMKREMERRVEEREREMEKIKLQREQEEDREEMAQEQDKPVLGRGRKRKR
ncbi:hypothetical protein SLS56_010705 [Neofusicoccum ribis]|uniref:Uncharacterized protein n=1 Tax=Neofusicoccum ribis TaxID=45134 RepID=A0ABR3SE40_9PEZI